MKESLFYASQEIKRAEHLLYVSLKYTRTGDVIHSLILRLIASYDFVIDGLVQINEEKIGELPSSPFAKVAALKKVYEDNKEMQLHLEFYLLLRKISRSKREAFNEFRRNLTVRADLDGQMIEITIDIASDYYHKSVDFLRFVKKHMDT
ncbi:hypothetical protein H6503_00535 [Candidatus Woesearchaeota archaeon]|nr:hypothetical protein [Candidatus Woesearchaeota archaeon]